MKNHLFVRLMKGFIIGASMLIPGVSGGTMAIILGIYDELIHSVSCFRENIRENLKLLMEYGVSGAIGVLLLAGPMLKALTAFRQPMMFFFMGAILGSLPPLYKKATISHLKFSNIIVAFIGGISGVMLTLLPEGLFVYNSENILHSYLILFCAGVVVAIALVLPGISGSYVLLMMGIYDTTLWALKSADLYFLTPIAVGALAGTFFTAELLEKEMKRHPQFTYMLIIGFMLGSLLQVFPGIPTASNFLLCSITFCVGLCVILFIGRKNRI
ncbi:DUF368 domain-containing protein [Anaerovorax sp. IOR16]|uniref:DUF368 domain-containing protein n=1 Tax=Anaerovorax sp. IOR16 TaxID=2773458 RepID=UPI0019D246DF|nr:DUF368 domain-containing protein [Anaerovorax sp. IOR16]